AFHLLRVRMPLPDLHRVGAPTTQLRRRGSTAPEAREDRRHQSLEVVEHRRLPANLRADGDDERASMIALGLSVVDALDAPCLGEPLEGLADRLYVSLGEGRDRVDGQGAFPIDEGDQELVSPLFASGRLERRELLP